MPKILTEADIADFRDRLCDVAERLFAERGPEAVTIRELAGALGVSPMTPYRYFKDKDAILAATRARAFDRHAQAMEDAYASVPDDPMARSTCLRDTYIRFAMDNPEAYKLMFDTRQASAGDYPDLVRAGERSRATMTGHVRDLIDAELIKGDAETIGHLHWAALHGPLMLHFSGLLTPGVEARDLINGLGAALWKSIARPTRVQAQAA